jgi:hypothetical protein
MKFLCKLGIHKRVSRPTARPGTTVRRCARCNVPKVVHARKKLRKPPC